MSRKVASRLAASFTGLIVFAFCASVAGCGKTRPPDWLWPWSEGDDTPQFVDLVAVVPLREVPGRADARDKRTGRLILEDQAGRAVTAQIYGYLAEQTRYRFAPDMSVDSFLESIDYRDPAEVVRQVAEEFDADAVVFGTVFRFQDRVGTMYAASEPASVSFELSLYSRAVDAVVWRDRFDETQEPLSSNFFKAWMFWEAGPHWFSSRELAGLGVKKLLDSIPRGQQLQPLAEDE